MTNYINKIMVDSRFRSSGTASNFTIELIDYIQLGEYTG